MTDETPPRARCAREALRYRVRHAMTKGRPIVALTSAEPAALSASMPRDKPLMPEEFEVASHDVLFAASSEVRCDACEALLCRDDTDGDGYEMGGRGVYLWARGGEVRFEEAPLCPSCASAIGMTALARWEIEEEEG